MRKASVRISRELLEKVQSWSRDDQLFFSAFLKVVGEDAFDAVLSRPGLVITGALENGGNIIELSFWITLPDQQNRFTLRRVSPGSYTIGI